MAGQRPRRTTPQQDEPTWDCDDVADTEADAERDPLEVTLGDAPVLLLALGLGVFEALREAEDVPDGVAVAVWKARRWREGREGKCG
jgi:hypothetical protein